MTPTQRARPVGLEAPTAWTPYFLRRFRRALFCWFEQHQRDLPWRRTRDPYAIWVSEIMLQQTRVDQVMPYFERFLKAFPNVKALAAAPMDRLLKVWEGMGYYARARNMHRAAQQIARAHGGRVPDTLDELSALPGIGPYTAAAVLSIAYNHSHAVVDGNVARVLCRVFLIRQDPSASLTKRALERIADALLPRGRASVFNQAMMELGALVCTPRSPQCPVCPIQTLCAACAQGDPASLPVRSPKKPKPHYHVSAGIIWRGREVLIAKRRPEGLLGGLWEFPGGKQETGESLEECLRREVREELDIEIAVERPFMAVKHAYTHFRITLHAFHCAYVSGVPKPLGCAQCRWVRLDQISEYAFPRADKRLLEALLLAR